MSAVSAVARRYAEVLLEVAQEAGVVSETRTALEGLEAVFATEPEAFEALRNPRVSVAEKERLLRALVPDAPAALSAFFALLARRRRLAALPDVVEAFRRLADEAEGVLEATVEAPVPLTPAERERLTRLLGERYKRTIRLVERPRPDLIGGLRVRVGDEVLDASLRRALTEVRRRLVTRGTEGRHEA
jgi:F-type H+-transporting ATPase subunit delta